ERWPPSGSAGTAMTRRIFMATNLFQAPRRSASSKISKAGGQNVGRLRRLKCEAGRSGTKSWVATSVTEIISASDRSGLNGLDKFSALLDEFVNQPPRLDHLASVAAVFQCVPVALRSAPAGPVHAADAISLNR